MFQEFNTTAQVGLILIKVEQQTETLSRNLKDTLILI